MDCETHSGTGYRRVHIAGIGGCGMNALAQLLQAEGCTVTGSDRLRDQGGSSAVLDKLANSGIELLPQDGTALASNVDALATSSAIESDNPEILAARDLGIPIIHRSRMLAECVADKLCIAVGGTSGKSTITAMLGWIFEQLGKDPTVVNGAPLLDWISDAGIGNVRTGNSDIAIVEADESDKSLLEFDPAMATISNVSRDHFGIDESYDLFLSFAKKSRGKVICGPEVSMERFDIDNISPARLDKKWPRGFRYEGIDFEVGVLGEHNIENALIAVAVCHHWDLDMQEVACALKSFRGVERRLQVVGKGSGIKVIDDYAHNPAKIAAAWRAAAADSTRLIGIWRPHGFGPLAAMKEDLAQTFKDGMGANDILHILPVYYAGGTTARQVTSRQFVDMLQAEGITAYLADDYDSLFMTLKETITSGDTILCMGARDPELPRFADRISSIFGGLKSKMSQFAF